MPDQTSAPEPFTAGPASSYPPVIAELTAERDRLAAELDEQLDLGAELLARLMAVSAIAERWTSRPGTPEHDCGIDIREALKGVTAPVPGSSHRAQEPDTVGTTVSDARRLLDQAIDAGLPMAGGRVRKLLKALRRELAQVDAQRAGESQASEPAALGPMRGPVDGTPRETTTGEASRG